MRSNAVDVVVIDSVAALVPKAEIEGEMGDSHVGLQARLMSQGAPKAHRSHREVQRLVIFINQIREKIGVMFGSPETTTGGNALKFYSSVRLDIRRIGQLKDGGQRRRQPHQGDGGEEQGRAAVPEGRVRHPVQPRRVAEGELLDLGMKAGRQVVLRSTATWYSMKHVRQFLTERSDVARAWSAAVSS